MRSFHEELSYIQKISPCKYEIKIGFVPNMRVPGIIYVNDELKQLLFEELENYISSRGVGFLPAVIT
jgi:tRNA-splicing ligase RtcB